MPMRRHYPRARLCYKRAPGSVGSFLACVSGPRNLCVQGQVAQVNSCPWRTRYLPYEECSLLGQNVHVLRCHRARKPVPSKVVGPAGTVVHPAALHGAAWGTHVRAVACTPPVFLLYRSNPNSFRYNATSLLRMATGMTCCTLKDTVNQRIIWCAC